MKTTQLIETKIYGQEEYRVATENKTTIKKKKKNRTQKTSPKKKSLDHYNVISVHKLTNTIASVDCIERK
jgi:hypothetical protein